MAMKWLRNIDLPYGWQMDDTGLLTLPSWVETNPPDCKLQRQFAQKKALAEKLHNDKYEDISQETG